FYCDGCVAGDRVLVGFPYTPLSLAMSIPGEFLGVDYRTSIIAATALAAWLLVASRPGPVASSAAALLLTTPRIFLIEEKGYTDPYVLLCLALVVFCSHRWRKALPVALGLLFAVKQYSIFFLPLALLLFPEGTELRVKAKSVGWALAIAALLILP